MTAARGVYDPAWSPDGRVIAFRQRKAIDDLHVESQLDAILADGSELIVLLQEQTVTNDAESRRGLGSISWSADGQQLAFASLQGSDHVRIWTLSRSGGQQRLLLPDLERPHFNPAWAHHAPTALAYVAEGVGDLDVWLLDMTMADEPTNLTQGRLDVRGGVRWSPSGEHLAFSALDPEPPTRGGGDTEIYLLELATLELTQLTHNDAADGEPTWSADGKSLIISSDRAGLTMAGPGSPRYKDLWRVDLADPERAINITAGAGGDDRQADWYWPGVIICQ